MELIIFIAIVFVLFGGTPARSSGGYSTDVPANENYTHPKSIGGH